MSPLLKIDDLAVDFIAKGRITRVVEGVSFTVNAGEAVGLVGESGSGKSLTSLAVLRLIPEPPGLIARGRIEFEGVDLLQLPRDVMPEIRGSKISMIFQEPMSSLNPVMTIGDQVGEAIKLHRRMSRSDRLARVVELLQMVGIPDAEARMGAYPHQFSGGMRQRVMIAMALACEPRLLIADEPTTALDVTIQAQVLDVMNKVRQDTGTAVLLISHDLSVIAEVCDRVVVMYAGRVVETGPVATIFDAPAHPYTDGLLRSIVRPGHEERRLYQIPGSVPPAGSIKAGCPFQPRCPRKIDRCAVDMPPMFDHGAGHGAACWVTAPVRTTEMEVQ
ncbi:peptide ABC transporter ATP-binding protein [Devosia epidermidihirudinis]|uniref:Peptide ABC transporter ATP-binding protein n=1 Tax=Devosia epidermidihirudinis TaxID=1293439 RepID=A0A0F5Q9K8_9HYPH|nr:ABC transporter ATP-binding protein [Devosia epidermidihirudinis]KKC37416.1 peptide ABC transporter ATP-binding protein [Devosia epidermidihirudinis]